MKKIIVIASCALSCAAFAGHGCGGHGHHGCGGWGRPPHHYAHHHHGGSFWGHGGCNFWPGFTAGVVGGLLTDAIVSRPVVVSQPAVVTQPVIVQQPQTIVVTQPQPTVVVAQPQSVWVEGRYVDQVQANGSVVRIWQPGHYETR